MIGEWVALPVLTSAGASGGPLDPLAEQVMYPTAERLLQHCDAVLRLPGESKGADQDVAIATAAGSRCTTRSRRSRASTLEPHRGGGQAGPPPRSNAVRRCPTRR